VRKSDGRLIASRAVDHMSLRGVRLRRWSVPATGASRHTSTRQPRLVAGPGRTELELELPVAAGLRDNSRSMAGASSPSRLSVIGDPPGPHPVVALADEHALGHGTSPPKSPTIEARWCHDRYALAELSPPLKPVPGHESIPRRSVSMADVKRVVRGDAASQPKAGLM